MLKVLFIRAHPVSPEPKVEKEALTLGCNGYDVEVLAWDRSLENSDFENKGSYKIKRIKLKAPYGKPELVLKLFFWSFYELIHLIRSNYDIIHAVDLDTLIPAVIISKILNKPLVYDCADFYADSLPENVPKQIRNMVANIEIYFSKFADFVILVDEARKTQFNNELKRTIIINNTPMVLEPKIKLIKENEDFIIFYAGILYKNRGLDKIIEATKGIPGINLVIAGYDVGYDDISIRLKNTENVSFLGKITYDEVIERTIESDMTFAFYDPKIPNHKYASPNKLFEAMMCGKPILTNYGTVMADYIVKENCGVLVDYENVKEIEEAIILLKNDSSLRKKLGKNGFNAYKTKYNWNIMKKRLLDSYESLGKE